MRRLTSRPLKAPRGPALFDLLLLVMIFPACGGPAPLAVDMPLHLEEHLDAATIVGSEVPADMPQPVEWRFDEPQPTWIPLKPIPEQWEAVDAVRVADALRVFLNDANRHARNRRLIGSVFVDLPDWSLDDWAHVEIRARTQDPMLNMGVSFNYSVDDPVYPGSWFPYYSSGEYAPVITDGTVQTYRLSLDHPSIRQWEGPWTQLGIWFNTKPEEQGAAFDLLSVRVVPKAYVYSDAAVGVQETKVGNRIRRAVYTHTPGRLEYQVQVPESARLDVGLGVLSNDVPVTFRVSATASADNAERLLEETLSDGSEWQQRSVDLAAYAGRAITLSLETDATVPGAVAFWAAPTLSGLRDTDKPNVIFYIIDGGGAEYTSLYGYNRRTTPNLDRLAAEGAVFERAYSNASWTRPSTASFMTSLQHSALGGAKGGFNIVPEDVPTMAQHMHRGGYQTAVFTANPNAGRMSGLDREVDFFQEDWDEFLYGESGHWRESSRYLHDAFWKWREAYPGEPYWVHFQTIDLHGDFPAVAPFGGLFVGPGEMRTWEAWRERLDEEGGWDIYSEAWERTGLSRPAFWSVRLSFYGEAMAYNDYQLGRLADRLKASGEWENTLLIIAADHSIRPAVGDMGVAIQDSLLPRWMSREIRPKAIPMLRPSVSRVPLVFIWPGHIAGGQRFSAPAVSMLDVLPTILDLIGSPQPEITQGLSLAPVLLGEGGVQPRPVILDEFYEDRETGILRGVIEVVDGRWGASLVINQHPDWPPELKRPVPLLLYDLWTGPDGLHSVHEQWPDLVEKYTAFLEAQFEAHQALAQLFTPEEGVVLTPEQLETLRALGYIQ